MTNPTTPAKAEERKKASYIGTPAVFKLELACQQLNAAFPDAYGCYLVGSAMQRPDWRDVDIRMMMPDEEFARLFPDARLSTASWELDPRWLILTTSIADWLKTQTGLPVDFQFQPATFANEKHKGPRSAIGMRMISARSQDHQQ